MNRVAVVLSGCGHLDGAEIRESVLSLLFLDREGAQVSIFAPNIAQQGAINHLTGKPMGESRNVLVEAARIARGAIKPLSELKPESFDALVMPGGYGAAKNLSDFAFKGKDAAVLPELKKAIRAFADAGKPIGAICIAPAVLAAALGDKSPLVTIGDDATTAEAIAACGGKHQNAATQDAVIDEKNRLATCSAYMRDDRISHVADGIEKVIKAVLRMAQEAARRAA